MSRGRLRSIAIAAGALVVVTAVAVVAFAVGRSTTTPAPTSTVVGTPNASSPFPLQSGIYTDGREGTPHYFIAVTVTGGGTFSGTVSFLAQDGQTTAAFAFTATTQSGFATLRTSDGRLVSAPVGNGEITLGNCLSYLRFAQSNAECTFDFVNP